MSHRRSEYNADRRRNHQSIASYATNLSRADSSVSFASAWTAESAEARQIRIAQFPSPPTGFPITSQTLDTDTEKTPTRSDFGIINATHEQGRPSPPQVVASSSKGGETNPPSLARRGRIPSLRVDTHLRDRPPTIAEEGTATHSRNPAPSSYKRPPSFEWQEAGSILSIDSTEDRLLSTSFITSLLGEHQLTRNAPVPARERPPRQPQRSRFEVPTPVSDVQSSITAGVSPHPLSGVEPYGPSESLHGHDRPVHVAQTLVTYPPSPPEPGSSSPAPNKQPASHWRQQQTVYPLTPTSSQIIKLDDVERPRSNRNSAEYSETLASVIDEQIQSAVRTKSVPWSRASNGARPIGVAPAYTVQTNSWKHGSLSSNNTTRTDPPKHIPDIPQSVGGHDDATGFEFDDMSYVKREDNLHHSRHFSPALPSTAGTSREYFDDVIGSSQSSRRRRRQSLKSNVSSFVSRVSRSTLGSIRQVRWLSRRPLPDLPPLPNAPPEIYLDEDTRKTEEQIPLPALMKRAGALEDMLAHSRSSTNNNSSRRSRQPLEKSYSGLHDENYSDYDDYMRRTMRSSDLNVHPGGPRPLTRTFSFLRRASQMPPPDQTTQLRRASNNKDQRNTRKKRMHLILSLIILAILLAVGAGIGLYVNFRKNGQPKCDGNFTGAACDLDASCVCTSAGVGQCNQLAQSLVDLIPTVNEIFTANFTPASMSNAVWNAQGSPVGSLCAQQALLVDVAPGLQVALSPNRTAWAQAAILWNVALSADLSATLALRTFAAKAPWTSLLTMDGPLQNSTPTFQTTQSGFVFDFGAQTVTPPDFSFQTDGTLNPDQLVELGPIATQALNRMYSFGAASATQRQKSLTNYWQTVLQQQAADLPKFLQVVRSGPFLIPFDSTGRPNGQPVVNLLTTSATAAFPPPLACYPGLSTSQFQQVNTIESSVFGLSAAQPPVSFDTSCFPSRPVYGVVDFLNLRLPFLDSRTGFAKQAAVVTTAATPRVVVYSGEVLSAIPWSNTPPNISTAALQPREYGTRDHINHVVLNYLTAIQNTTLAMELVKFVLQGSSAPPPNSSDLFNALSSLPTMEFAMFGSVTPPDLGGAVSAFSTPTGNLFFGSSQAQAFRTWALQQSTDVVAWTEFATSPEVVHEGAATDQGFESVWTPAAQLIQAGLNDPSTVGNVTRAFASLGKFSP
ncbi:hypothetical protein BD410DRAFT_218024 [Rickenella mellea]|uniref:Uncharacterized protein n=1 Tax=Rickenella mellea TaxID=50990 RepID=A0A4Y7QLX8_9AGAM|nr:hypothetical protein BD410DRAFT_218024 [Rickenella mellea]